MKINMPMFKVLSDNMELDDKLRVDLNTACFMFTKSKTKDVATDAKQLAIDIRIALNTYMTGLKIQKFANNAKENDRTTIELEINDFIKQFDKITK